MNVQRCWFLLLPACRPASRMRARWCVVERTLGERADGALGRDRVPDRSTRRTSSVARRGCGHRERPCASRRLAAGARVAPGRRPGRASAGRRPSSSTAANCASASGSRSSAAAAASSPAAAVERAAEGPGEERGDGRAVAGELVQPGVLPAGDDERLDRRGARVVGPGRAGRRGQPLQMAERHDRVVVAVREQDRAAIPGDGRRGADVGHTVAARPEVDAGRQPGERVGDRVGDRQVGEAERLAGEAVRVGRASTSPRRPRPAGRRRPPGSRRSPPIEWPTIAADGHLGPLEQRVEGGERIGPNSPAVSGSSSAGWRRGRGRRTSGSGTRRRGGTRPSAASGRGPTPSRGRGPRPGPGAPSRAGMNQAGRSRPADVDGRRLVRQAEVGRRDPGRVAARIAGPDAVGEREAVGEPERAAAERPPAIPARRTLPMRRRGRHGTGLSSAVGSAVTPVQRSMVRSAIPHASSASKPGAQPTQIKAAWRRLARAHHPDLTGDDPAASRVATRRMAEINDAYAALTRESGGPVATVADREPDGRRSSRVSRADAAGRRRRSRPARSPAGST